MIGKIISHYKILEKIGEGGMGEVYKAEDTKLKRIVALKFLPPLLTGDEHAKKRFIQEAQAASALQHNNICAIHEIDDTPDGRLFICMDYYPGETLNNRTAHGPMPLRDLVEIARQTAEGLAKSHGSGIVHRDIKPANIAITEDGVVKILDFGVAKLADRTRMTRMGATLGTVAYMSPEQARGDDVGPPTDVWSLGVTLYEMLTGRLPFRADHDTAVVYKILNEPHEPVAASRPDTPEKLAAVVDKALAKSPDERYADAGEMANDLQAIAAELDARDRGAAVAVDGGKPSPIRHARIWVPLGIVVLAVVAIMLLKPLFFGDETISAPRPIAVISFENQTGDPQYDYLREVIPNLLITKLEQSKYLSVISWERMHDLLAQSGRKDQKLIDKDTGFELCRIDGINTIVVGSYSRAGDVFVTDAKVLDVHSKELLKTVTAKGEGVGSVLASQIDELGREISRGVGLSERAIAAGGPPIADVTTRSMDAYSYFLRGREECDALYATDARRSLERAVELDSTFAVAWLYLGRTYLMLEDVNSGDHAFAKAEDLSGSAPEKDRLYIEAVYANTIEGDQQKYHELLQELVRKYPKEKVAYSELGLYYRSAKRYDDAKSSYEKALQLDPEYGDALNGIAYVYAALEDYPTAIEYLQRYAAVSPGEVNPIDSMAEMYFRLGDLDRAAELYENALDTRQGFAAEVRRGYIAALQEDYAAAIEWCDRFVAAAPSTGLTGTGRLVESFLLAMAGNDTKALSTVETARAAFEPTGYWRAIAGTWWIEGWVRYLRGENEDALRCYAESVSQRRQVDIPSPRLQLLTAIGAGLIDLRQGRTDAARGRLSDIEAARARIDETDRALAAIAEDHSLLYEAEVLLAEGRVDDAVEVCKKRSDVGIPFMNAAALLFYNFPAERDVLARAYAAKGDVDDAIVEYERLVTFDPSAKERRLVYPLFHYRLGLLYEEKGRTSDAVREYQRFLDITGGVGGTPPEAADARRRLDLLKQTSG